MSVRDYLIDCEALGRIIGDDDVSIVDCRFDLRDPASGRVQYLDSHIPGAVFADLEEDLSGPVSTGTGRHPLPAAESLASTLGRLGIGNDTDVVCYDQSSGALAARLWWLLRWLGHDKCRLLDGGIAHWQRLGLPLESGEASAVGKEFRARPVDDRIVLAEEILESGAAKLGLVDARDEERFAGRSEPLDAVAGHIPGAVNLPFTRSLQADSRWRSAPELRRLWEDTLGPNFGTRSTVMCGSGVTACHLVVSAMIAGLPEPRVYVGSWSEWITDPNRPIISTL